MLRENVIGGGVVVYIPSVNLKFARWNTVS